MKKGEKKATPTASASKRLVRSKSDRVLAGVCGGLGEYFNIDPTIIRLLFALFVVSGGSGVFIYIILWVILPESGDEGRKSEDVMKDNGKEIEMKAKEIGKGIEGFAKRSNVQIWLGVFVVLMGVWMTLSNFGLTSFFNMGWYLSKFWPLFIIGLGVLILVKNEDEK